jgi:hypothetical protein
MQNWPSERWPDNSDAKSISNVPIIQAHLTLLWFMHSSHSKHFETRFAATPKALVLALSDSADH